MFKTPLGKPASIASSASIIAAPEGAYATIKKANYQISNPNWSNLKQFEGLRTIFVIL